MIKPPPIEYTPITYSMNVAAIIKRPKKYKPKSLDLLEAQTAVDWAVSKLPSLQRRLNGWINRNIDVGIENTEPNVPNDILIAITKRYLPLSFNAEFGAYLNSIRTSLDLLTTSLAHRYNMNRPDKHHFPIVDNATLFNSGTGFKGDEFVNGLPAPERKILESFKPYQGGNELLWLLHQFDIQRKHRRLLYFEVSPSTFRISGWGFTPLSSGVVHSNNKTMLGLITKGAAQPDVHFTPNVMINEGTLSPRQPAVTLLYAFANSAQLIIKAFDIP